MNSGEYSTDPDEAHWRINSSFSPTQSGRWNCGFRPDGLSSEAPPYESSLSSSSKRSKRVRSGSFRRNHHFVSDGALSYFESPSSVPADASDLAILPIEEPRLEALFPEIIEGHSSAGLTAVSNSCEISFGCSPFSQCESSSKRPTSFLQCNFSGRRSFMAKPVYPVLFQNPIPDPEGALADVPSNRWTPCENKASSTFSPATSSHHINFKRTVNELQKLEASSDPSRSSAGEGFKQSNASSFDLGFYGESSDISEKADLESLRPSLCSGSNQKCGLCGNFMWQKSPWSSSQIVKSGDLPVAGVLYCSHVFHADCLEQTTPKTQIHDPPCPVCQNLSGQVEELSLVPKSYQTTFESACGNQGANIAGQHLDQMASGFYSNSMMKNSINKHYLLKGRTRKGVLDATIFQLRV